MDPKEEKEVKQQMLPEPTVIGITVYVLGCMLKALIGFITLKFVRHWWNKWFGKKSTKKEDMEDEDIICQRPKEPLQSPEE